MSEVGLHNGMKMEAARPIALSLLAGARPASVGHGRSQIVRTICALGSLRRHTTSLPDYSDNNLLS